MTHILRLYYNNGGSISVKAACYKDGYDFGPPATHMYPIIGQVPLPLG